MQSTNYSCGPAALATVLQNMGINSTEQGLMGLAGTDTSGTTMYGLARAARSKGLNVSGMRLDVDELRKNNIVHVILNGTPHYTVIREITETSVKLADPSLGNIVMSREKFAEIFTSHALVISNPNVQLNQTATSNSTVINPNVQLNQTATNTSENLTVIPNNLTHVNGTTDQTNNQSNQTENTIPSEPVNNNTLVISAQEANQIATIESKNLTVSNPNVQVNQIANNTRKNLTVNVQEVNQTASTSKNLTVIPNVQETNNITSESKNLTVSNLNVQELNQIAATNTIENLTVNVQEVNQTAATSESNSTVSNPNVQELNQTADIGSAQAENLTQVNGTTDQTNNQLNQSTVNINLSESVNNGTDTISAQPENLTIEEIESTEEQISTSEPVSSSMELTAEEMQSIRGKVIWKTAGLGALVGAGIGGARAHIKGQCWRRGAKRGAVEGAIVGSGKGLLKAGLKGTKWAKRGAITRSHPSTWRTVTVFPRKARIDQVIGGAYGRYIRAKAVEAVLPAVLPRRSRRRK